MGLDMYLKAEKYVGGWNHSEDSEKQVCAQVLQAIGAEDLLCSDAPSVTVGVNVAYWRKANAIHGWFINNLADGVDECQSIFVSAEKLKELVDTCKKALQLYEDGETAQAGDLLAPTEGFFFGSYDVDDYWKDDVEHTIRQLEPLLKLKGYDFHYQASW